MRGYADDRDVVGLRIVLEASHGFHVSAPWAISRRLREELVRGNGLSAASSGWRQRAVCGLAAQGYQPSGAGARPKAKRGEDTNRPAPMATFYLERNSAVRN